MSWFVGYVRSSVGAKTIMAVTGLLMVLFAIVHMIGHLQMFGGQDLYNTYANFLQSLWEVKWPTRAGLISVFVIHLVSAIRLVTLNRAARPVKYARYTPVRSSVAGRTMALTGIMLLLFVLFHLVHFTFGNVQPEYFHLPDGHGRHDAYTMFVRAFQNPAMYGIYVVAMAVLSLQLPHGSS